MQQSRSELPVIQKCFLFNLREAAMSIWVFIPVLIVVFIVGLAIGLVIQWKDEPDDEVLELEEESKKARH